MDPRGIRNNNPGNIDRNATHWQGQVWPGSDARFATFSSMAYGCRAIAVIISNYQAAGFKTYRQMINRWAPPVENDTNSYVDAVCADCGVHSDLAMPQTIHAYVNLVAAIIHHENGLNGCMPWVGPSIVTAGVKLACLKLA